MSELEPDMGESPLYDARDTRFKPGQSGNPAGRPKGSGKKPARSKMRNTLKRLYELEPDSIELIRQSMTGKDKNGVPVEAPSKEKVDLAKFVVKAIESMNNSCLREEGAIINIRDKGNEEGADELQANQSGQAAIETGAFSLDMEQMH